MKKPLIGLLAFIVVLFTMPLGHTIMILIEKLFGPLRPIPRSGGAGPYWRRFIMDGRP